MAGNLYFKVNVPVNVVRPEFEFPDVPAWSQWYSHMRPPAVSVLSNEFCAWLESKSMRPRDWASTLLFYAHTNSRTSVHVDVGCWNIWAMNIVLGAGQVDMHWHLPADSGAVGSGSDLNYIKYPETSPIVESTVLDAAEATVSRIGVPHSSVNTGIGAWVLSLRMAPDDMEWSTLKGCLL
jgi:hypothetical protein